MIISNYRYNLSINCLLFVANLIISHQKCTFARDKLKIISPWLNQFTIRLHSVTMEICSIEEVEKVVS